MTPRSDFVCLSPKCRGEDGATVYELPVTATRCPVCGSKRLQRIWSANIATKGVARHVDALVEPGYVAQAESRSVARALAPRDSVVAGPANQMGSLIAKATERWGGAQHFAGASAGPPNKAARAPGVVLGNPQPAGTSPHVPLAAPRPAPGSPRWNPKS